MAEARFVADVEYVPVVYPRSVVEIRLTLDEAETLVDVLSHVGGSAAATRRVHVDHITAALGELGITSFYTGEEGPRADRTGNITFTRQLTED